MVTQIWLHMLAEKRDGVTPLPIFNEHSSLEGY